MKSKLLSAVAILAATSINHEQGTRQSLTISPSKNWLLPEMRFTQSFGRPFFGRTNGTRKAMRAAAKRRRINAKLPK